MLPSQVVQWLDAKIANTEKLRDATNVAATRDMLNARLSALREVLAEFGKATAKEENECPAGAPAFVVLRRNDRGGRCFLGVGNSNQAAQRIVREDNQEHDDLFDDDDYEVLPTTIEGDKRAS